MIVYVDILICLNTVITYFILLAVKAINRNIIKIIRLVLASLIGGFSSLYILLPQQSAFIEILIKLVLSGIIVSIAFGTESIKKVLRSIFLFFAISFVYAGFMLGFWYIFKPNGMVINNGVIYFQISPVILIFSTVVCYLLIIFLKKFLNKKDEHAEKKKVKILYSGKEYFADCMVDSGNSVKDPVGICKILIIDKQFAFKIFGNETTERVLKLQMDGLNSIFRVIPYKTVSESSIMPAIKIDKAIVDNKEISDVLIGIVNTSFDGDFNGIISNEFYS